MKKLLIICGPTATGKTLLGLLVAKQFNGEIISADSRQVYIGMDIGTGKDIPSKVKSQKSKVKSEGKIIYYYKIRGIKLWGYDLVNPDEEFSVAHFNKIAEKIINNIWKRKKLPIIVGGAGLYLKSLTETIDTITIPPDRKLREKLKDFSIKDLQKKLKNIDLSKYKKMNQSDRNNPRRLIRAIEIASNEDIAINKRNHFKYDSMFWIGLKTSKKVQNEKINKRVEQRIKNGAEKEVKKLLKKGYGFKLPAMSAMGYRQWQLYFFKKATKEEIVNRWKLDEQAYARRQLTWFKKNKQIRWFDISNPNFKKQVVKQVKQWYSES